MDESSSSSGHLPAAVKQLFHFPFLRFLSITAAGAAAALWLLPPVSFALGSGPFAVWATIFIVFFAVILLRKWIFRHIYYRPADDSDAALLEYFTQQMPDQDDDEDKQAAVQLMENALHLRDVPVSQCMTPRSDLVCISEQASIAELRRLFADSKLSRIVISDRPEARDIRGYVHVQQMFGQKQTLKEMALPLRFVSAGMAANDLLHLFVRTRTNIACVADEQGQVAGIVTLEDALEQLFGAIDDEHD